MHISAGEPMSPLFVFVMSIMAGLIAILLVGIIVITVVRQRTPAAPAVVVNIQTTGEKS